MQSDASEMVLPIDDRLFQAFYSGQRLSHTSQQGTSEHSDKIGHGSLNVFVRDSGTILLQMVANNDGLGK